MPTRAFSSRTVSPGTTPGWVATVPASLAVLRDTGRNDDSAGLGPTRTRGEGCRRRYRPSARSTSCRNCRRGGSPGRWYGSTRGKPEWTGTRTSPDPSKQARLVGGERQHDVPGRAVQRPHQIARGERGVDDRALDHVDRQVDPRRRGSRDVERHRAPHRPVEVDREPVERGQRLGGIRDPVGGEAPPRLVHQRAEPLAVRGVECGPGPGVEQERDARVRPVVLQREHGLCGERPQRHGNGTRGHGAHQSTPAAGTSGWRSARWRRASARAGTWGTGAWAGTVLLRYADAGACGLRSPSPPAGDRCAGHRSAVPC